jgi:1-acyl-sn-glycerol-3-phosphate acyltransferase
MTYAWRYLRSLVFVLQMYAAMLVFALWYTPQAMINRDRAYAAVHAYCRWVRWTARWMVGLHSEVRGEVPTDEVILASKHQSFFDIIIIVSVVPRPRFIMKSSLRWAPILGWYAKRIGCVAVDRGKRAKAVQQMVEGVTAPDAPKGQLVIYPQGTRVAPDAKRPYKVGVGALYAALGQPVVPAATNVGVFWPRTGVYRKPGLAVVEFLPRIAPGLGVEPFMAEIEQVIETASDHLIAEARAGLQR